MVNINSYIPVDRRLALSTNQPLPQTSVGSVLIADISGFTSLTAWMVAAFGEHQGAEIITEQLNLTYTHLISQVHACRGSVVNFVGDAIICWFDGDDGLRGLTCGLMLQQVFPAAMMAQLPAERASALKLRVVVVQGEVQRLVVGDSNYGLMDVLAGQTLTRLEQAKALAEPDEVLVDEQIATTFKSICNVQTWRQHPTTTEQVAVVSALKEETSPSLWPKIASLSDDEAKKWVPPLVYKRLQIGQQFLAEFRPAVALFLQFQVLDYDRDEQASDRLNQYICWVQEVLARYEGTLIQLTLGDKGSFLYAAFGALISHTDDVVRGVKAALVLQKTPPRLAFVNPVQLGLTYGQMRTGAYGSPLRQTYGVIGDKTNLAARLMTAASPGQILCDFEIYQHARQSIDFKILTPIRVKGKAGLIRVYKPLLTSPPEKSTFLSASHPLIGRQAEVTDLKYKLQHVMLVKKLQIVVIEGEPGIGKSRLILEMVYLARELGLVGLLGLGQSIEQQTPYRVWRDIFEGYFDIEVIDDGSRRLTQVDRLAHELVPDQISRLPLLNDILNLGLPENDLTASLTPTLRQQNLTLFLMALLQNWAKERPLIIVLEDAQWLDSLSWHFTLHLASVFKTMALPVLLVVVSRPMSKQETGWQNLNQIKQMTCTTTFALNYLTAQECVELAANSLGISTQKFPAPVVNLIKQQADGNPFFAEELIFALRDQGIIRLEANSQGETHCVIKGDLNQTQQTLPRTLQGLILARIDRLSPQKQLILKIASVIGRTFTYTSLHDLLNEYTTLDDKALKAELNDLTEYDFTILDAPDPELTYIFKHIVTQEVSYQTLLFTQRQTLHQKLAAWYRQVYRVDLVDKPLTERDDLAAIIPLLVHHYHQAEMVQEEKQFAILAAQIAAKRFANVEAVRHYNRSLELIPSDANEARYNLILERAMVYRLQGEAEAQQQDLQILRELAQSVQDKTREAEICVQQADQAYSVGDLSLTQQVAQQGIDLAQQINHKQYQAQSCRWLGIALAEQGNYEEAKVLYQKALGLFTEIRDEVGQAAVLNNLGVNYDYQGDLTTARTYYEQALAIQTRRSQHVAISNILSNLAGLLYTIGSYTQAIYYFNQGLLKAREIGFRRLEGMILGNMGYCLYSLGNYQQARECYQAAFTISTETDDRLNQGLVHQNMGLIAYDLDNYQSASDYFQQALSLLEEVGNRYHLFFNAIYTTRVLIRTQAFNSATEKCQWALTMAEEMKQTAMKIEAYSEFMMLHLQQNNLQQTQMYLTKILKHLEQDPNLEGIYQPLIVYLNCYQALLKLAPDQSRDILKQGHQLLQKRATLITDETMRQTYLENVPHHRLIRDIYLQDIAVW